MESSGRVQYVADALRSLDESREWWRSDDYGDDARMALAAADRWALDHRPDSERLAAIHASRLEHGQWEAHYAYLFDALATETARADAAMSIRDEALTRLGEAEELGRNELGSRRLV